VIDRLPAPAWRSLRGEPGWQPHIAIVPQLSAFGARMDVRRPPFDDVRVRRALNLAVDKARMVRALHGLATPAHGLLPPTMMGRDPALAPYPHDPARARALLAEAGHPRGLDLEYVTVDEEYAVRLAQLMQADLAEAGVRMTIAVRSWSAFLEETAAPVPPAFSYTSWLVDYPDPSNFLDVRFHSRFIATTNDSGYANPALDALLDRARASSEPAARAADYRAAERIVFDDAPWIWGYHPQLAVVIQPYVRDVAPHPLWVHDFTAAWLDLDERGQRLRR
jgi:ABC-type transport system substrate-binding protein